MPRRIKLRHHKEARIRELRTKKQVDLSASVPSDNHPYVVEDNGSFVDLSKYLYCLLKNEIHYDVQNRSQVRTAVFSIDGAMPLARFLTEQLSDDFSKNKVLFFEEDWEIRGIDHTTTNEYTDHITMSGESERVLATQNTNLVLSIIKTEPL